MGRFNSLNRTAMSRQTKQTTSEIWTIASLLRWGTDYAKERGIDSPRLTVELLLIHVLDCQRIDLYLDAERPLSQAEVKKFKDLFQRRLHREPLQYIIGEAHFMGLVLKVDRRVLIPRPETEVLVEHAIDLLRQFPPESSPRVLDIGTGSGNIAVSIAKYVPQVHVTAIDVSQDALDVARANALRHNVEERMVFRRMDVFSGSEDVGEFDCITSNPPYITRDERNTLSPEIIQHEPSVAVFDHDDGLSFFRRIAEIGKEVLRKNGWVLVETAYNQGALVQNIFSATGYQDIRLFKDYDGNDRVVQSRWSG